MRRTSRAVAPWRELTPDERSVAIDAEPALLDAAGRAWHMNDWHAHELPGLVVAAARRLGIRTYPAQVRRVCDETRRTVAHRRDWRVG